MSEKADTEWAGDDITDKQRRILDAALDIFAERGFAGTPTAEIAKRAGVAEGTIFKHYKTKKELLLGVVGPMVAKVLVPRVATPVQEILRKPWHSVDDVLRALFEERIHFVQQHPRLIRIVAQEISLQPEVRAIVFDAVRGMIYEDALALIRRLQAEGTLRKDVEALTIIRLVAGTIMTYSFTRVVLFPARSWDDAAEITAMVNVLSAGFKAPGASVGNI